MNTVEQIAMQRTQTKAQAKSNLKQRHLTQNVAFGVLWVAALIVIIVLAIVIGYVFWRGLPVVNLNFLFTKPEPGMGGKGGISTTVVTTLYMIGLTLIIATPLGVGAGIYLVEYAGEMGSSSQRMNQVVNVIRFAIETLAGVPSIIFGLFGFALFVTVMHLGLSLISGALAGACLVLPVIIRTTEESLLTVPRSYREGSLALGATQWQTNWKVVLPAAMPGIVTGVILSVGRIISETAVFYVTLGGSIHKPSSIFDQGRTMVLHLYSLMMDANAEDPAWGTAVVVVVSIVLINLSINWLSNRLSRSMSGQA